MHVVVSWKVAADGIQNIFGSWIDYRIKHEHEHFGASVDPGSDTAIKVLSVR